MVFAENDDADVGSKERRTKEVHIRPNRQHMNEQVDKGEESSVYNGWRLDTESKRAIEISRIIDSNFNLRN